MKDRAAGLAFYCFVVGSFTLACDSCAGSSRVIARRQVESAPAVAALRSGRFESAESAAEKVIATDAEAAQAQLVWAIAHYRATMHTFSAAVMGGATMLGGNTGYGLILRKVMDDTEGDLGRIDQHLAKAAVTGVSLELCLACWEYDWNRNGRIDDADRHFMEIEIDADGKPLPAGDKRRRPTYRFDLGDVHWARAMLAFQRAVLDLVLAYRFEDLPAQFFGGDRGEIRIPLGSAARIKEMRARVLEGFDRADACRQAYLAETDDDREWVPNPRQKNHPLPLPVDDKLFETWRILTDDLRKLARGDEGIDVAQAVQAGDHSWKNPPHGFIDVGRLFEHPSDIVIPTRQVEALKSHDPKAAEALLGQIFDGAFVPKMKASGLVTHVERMKAEVERGEESMERKLRYLLWLN